MSVETVADTVHIELPRNWFRVPSRRPVPEEWLARATANSAPVVRDALAEDLRRIAAITGADAETGTHPVRTPFVLIDSAATSVVQAFLTVDVFAANDDDREVYLQRVTSASAQQEPSAAYAQRIFMETLAGEQAVVVQDFIVQGDDPERGTLHERYLAAVFPAGLGVMTEVQITTPDFALFGNIIEYGNAIASTLTWSPSS